MRNALYSILEMIGKWKSPNKIDYMYIKKIKISRMLAGKLELLHAQFMSIVLPPTYSTVFAFYPAYT